MSYLSNDFVVTDYLFDDSVLLQAQTEIFQSQFLMQSLLPGLLAFPIDCSTGVFEEIWHCINFSILSNYKLINAQSLLISNHYADQVKHTACSSNERTIALYLNQLWPIEWGGDLILVNDLNEIAYACVAKPGRCVVFDSRYRYALRAPSRIAIQKQMMLIFQAEMAYD